ncbi:MAG: hypothetical protein ACM34I_10650 [bacterium]
MVFFMYEKHHFLLTDASVETVKELWTAYHAYRYDTCCSFNKYLRENGVDFRFAAPCLSPFGYSALDIDFSLN